MNKTIVESKTFIDDLKIHLDEIHNVDIVVCPPFTALHGVKRHLEGTNIGLGAQNMHAFEKGAYTGCISSTMIKEICDYVIIGHSERREFFFETNGIVNRKIKAALSHDLIPILCIGESRTEKEKGKTNEIITAQLKEGLLGLTTDDMRKVLVAYEPIWAISRGDSTVQPATPEEADETHNFIRNTIKELYGEEISQNIRLLYGGSVKPTNVKSLLTMTNIDGALIGGASLDNQFAEVVIIAENL